MNDTAPRTELGRALAALRPRTTTACERCGTVFETYADRVGRFCRPACRQAAWAAEHPDHERQRLRDYRARRKAERGGLA